MFGEKASALRGSEVFIWMGQWRETRRVNFLGDVGEGLGRSVEVFPAVRLGHLKARSPPYTGMGPGCSLVMSGA